MKKNKKSKRLSSLTARVIFVALAVALAVVSAVAQEGAPLPRGVQARISTDRWAAPVSAEALGPEETLAVAHINGYIRLWDTSTHLLHWEARPSTARVDIVAFAGTQAVVAASHDGAVTVLNAATGEVNASFKLSFCNKPCGLSALYAADDVILTLGVISEGETNQGTLKLWSLADGKLLQTHIVPQIMHVALSSDGRHVAWSTYDAPAPAYLALAVSLPDATPLPCGVSVNARVDYEDINLAFSPNSEVLTLFSPHFLDNSLVACIWSTAKATLMHTVTIPPHPEYSNLNILRGALFSAGSKWLLLAYEQGGGGCESPWIHDTAVVDVASGKVVALDDLSDDVSWVAHPTSAALHNVTSFMPIFVETDGAAVQLSMPVELSISSPWEESAVSEELKTPAWDALPPAWLVVNAHTRPIKQLAASTTGAEVISVDETGHTLRWLLNVPGVPVASFKTRGQLLYAPDGVSILETSPAVLVETGSREAERPQAGSLGAWRLDHMTRATLRRDPKLMTKALSWLPGGEILSCREAHDAGEVFMGSPKGPVRSFFEVISVDGASITPLTATLSFCPTASGVSAATMRAITYYNPTAESLYGAKQNGTARVQDLSTGEVISTLPGENLDHVALSPDGQWAAFYTHSSYRSYREDRTRTLHVFSVDAQAEAFSISFTTSWEDDEDAFKPIFSADGLVVFSEGPTLRVVDPALGVEAPAKATSLAGHTANISAATFSADGKTLFTAQTDGLIFAWGWPVL